MKLSTEPAPPIVRMTNMILAAAFRFDTDELRIFMDGDNPTLLYDGEEKPGPPANMFKLLVNQFLEFAETRRWPWMKRLKGRPLRIEKGELEMEGTFLLTSEDLRRELILTRVWDNGNAG